MSVVIFNEARTVCSPNIFVYKLINPGLRARCHSTFYFIPAERINVHAFIVASYWCSLAVNNVVPSSDICVRDRCNQETIWFLREKYLGVADYVRHGFFSDTHSIWVMLSFLKIPNSRLIHCCGFQSLPRWNLHNFVALIYQLLHTVYIKTLVSCVDFKTV